MDFTSNTATKIAEYVDALKERDQQKLLQALERKALMEETARLNKSVRKNTISIQEICDVLADVRKKRNRA
jgi:RNA polymerase-interacting CarD/CdnL/TRCF family regulator